MKRVFACVLLGAVGLFLGSPLPFGPAAGQSQAATAKPEVRKAIESANKQFLDALARGDGAGCAAVYAENAKIFPPNSPMLTGRKAIQEFWQGAINGGLKGATLTIVELEQHGDIAIEIGAYALDLRPAGKAAAKDEGKYVVVWKRQRDGSWKLAVDIFNTNLPAA